MPALLGKLKTSKNVDIEEYLDNLALEEEDLLEEHADMWVKPLSLESVGDVEDVVSELRKGNIILLNISPLYKKNTIKLKQAISELKGQVSELDGDIARITEEKVLVTPSRVKIAKK